WEFRSDGACVLLAAQDERTGKWSKLRAEPKAVRIRVTYDRDKSSEVMEFSFLDNGGLAVEKGAPVCVLKRAEGQDAEVKPAANELTLNNPENNLDFRFTRDNKPAAPPAPRVVVVSSARQNIVRGDVIKSIALTRDGVVAAWTEFGATQMMRVWDVSGRSGDP